MAIVIQGSVLAISLLVFFLISLVMLILMTIRVHVKIWKEDQNLMEVLKKDQSEK